MKVLNKPKPNLSGEHPAPEWAVGEVFRCQCGAEVLIERGDRVTYYMNRPDAVIQCPVCWHRSITIKQLPWLLSEMRKEKLR